MQNRQEKETVLARQVYFLLKQFYGPNNFCRTHGRQCMMQWEMRTVKEREGKYLE